MKGLRRDGDQFNPEGDGTEINQYALKNSSVLKQLGFYVLAVMTVYSSRIDFPAGFRQQEADALGVDDNFQGYDYQGLFPIKDKEILDLESRKIHLRLRIILIDPKAVKTIAKASLGHGGTGIALIETGMNEIDQNCSILEIDGIQFVDKMIFADFLAIFLAVLMSIDPIVDRIPAPI